MKALIDEVKEKFNEESIRKNGEDKHSINFSQPENTAVIDKLRNKLLTDKVTCDGNLDQFAKSNPFNGSLQYSSPSISGLSWAKKIVFK